MKDHKERVGVSSSVDSINASIGKMDDMPVSLESLSEYYSSIEKEPLTDEQRIERKLKTMDGISEELGLFSIKEIESQEFSIPLPEIRTDVYKNMNPHHVSEKGPVREISLESVQRFSEDYKLHESDHKPYEEFMSTVMDMDRHSDIIDFLKSESIIDDRIDSKTVIPCGYESEFQYIGDADIYPHFSIIEGIKPTEQLESRYMGDFKSEFNELLDKVSVLREYSEYIDEVNQYQSFVTKYVDSIIDNNERVGYEAIKLGDDSLIINDHIEIKSPHSLNIDNYFIDNNITSSMDKIAITGLAMKVSDVDTARNMEMVIDFKGIDGVIDRIDSRPDYKESFDIAKDIYNNEVETYIINKPTQKYIPDEITKQK